MSEFFFIIRDGVGSPRYVLKIRNASENEAVRIAKKHAYGDGWTAENPFKGLPVAWDTGTMSGWAEDNPQ